MVKLSKAVTATLDDGVVVTLSPHVLLAVRFMVEEYGSRGTALITAIKFIRMAYSLSLKDAKDIVDALRADPQLYN